MKKLIFLMVVGFMLLGAFQPAAHFAGGGGEPELPEASTEEGTQAP